MPATKKKPSGKTTAKPASPPREHLAAAGALKLVDEAAALLRRGISTGAGTSAKTRLAAKKKAHALLGKASTSLSGILDGGTSVLRKVIDKI